MVKKQSSAFKHTKKISYKTNLDKMGPLEARNASIKINKNSRFSCIESVHEQKQHMRSGAVVKHRIRDREVPGSIPTNSKFCFLEQETLSTLLSTGFYPGKKRATWISTSLLNVFPSINKVDYYYYYYATLLTPADPKLAILYFQVLSSERPRKHELSYLVLGHHILEHLIWNEKVYQGYFFTLYHSP